MRKLNGGTISTAEEFFKGIPKSRVDAAVKYQKDWNKRTKEMHSYKEKLTKQAVRLRALKNKK